MISPEIKEIFEERLRVMKILWLAMVLSVCMITGVAFVVIQGTPTAPDMVVFVLLGIAASNVLLSFQVERFLASEQNLKKAKKSDPKSSFRQLSQLVCTALLVRLALHESVVLFGLVASFLTQDKNFAIAAGIVALSLHFLAKPKEADLERAARISSY